MFQSSVSFSKLDNYIQWLSNETINDENDRLNINQMSITDKKKIEKMKKIKKYEK